MSDEFDPYHVWLGIPPEEQPPNHYRLLGLRQFEPVGDVISHALDQRLAYLRSLQVGKRGALSQRLLNEVSAAGVTLLDAKKKREYDQHLRSRLPAEPASELVTPKKSTLPTARPLEQPASTAAVVPIPEPKAAVAVIAVPVPSIATSAPPQPVPPQTPAPSPLVFSPTAPPTSAPLQRSGVGLAIVVVAACAVGLAATAGLVVWIRQISLRQQADGPIAQAPDKPPDAPSVPPVPPVPQHVPGPQPEVQVPTPPAPPPAPATADPGEAWVYADNSRGGFRRVSADRWVELAEKDSTWYRQVSATSDAIVLEQVGGSPTTVRLQADRAQRENPELTGKTIFFGKWRSQAGLPPFARRDPGNEKPLPPVNRDAYRQGLIFDGNSRLELPLPDELKQPGQPFTIEMWVRWIEPQRGSWFVECGELQLARQASSEASSEVIVLQSGNRQLHAVAKLAPLRFHHLAITSDGQELMLVINGVVHPAGKLPRPASLGNESFLVGHAAAGKNTGFRGALRGLRISSVNRYPSTTPTAGVPKLLAADDQTLLALDLETATSEGVALAGTTGGSGKRIGVHWVHLNAVGELAAEPVPGRVDLLRCFSAKNHTLEGETYRTRSQLDLKTSRGRTALLLPHLPPQNYRVEATVTRTAGEGGLVLGLVLDREPVAVLIDAAAGANRTTGVLAAGDRLLPGISSTSSRQLLPRGASQRLVCDVLTHQGMALVRVVHDGKMAYQWQGPIASAPVPDRWKLPTRTMFIGSQDAAFSVTELVLTPLPAPSSGALAESAGPVPEATVPAATNPGSSPPPAPRRLALPDADTLTAELEKAREIYQDELKKAAKPEQKADLARSIAATARGTAGDATARYVLFDLARKVFIQAADVKEATALAQAIAAEYETPANEPLLATLDALDAATMPGEERAVLAAEQIKLAEQLFLLEQFTLAGRLAEAAVQSVGRQKDAALKKSVTERRGHIVRTIRELQSVQASLTTLETKPDDEAANLAAGKFYCFVLEKWERGVMHLAKSGDPVFTEPAVAEKGLTDAASQAAAAELWLALLAKAPALTREDKVAIQRHAKRLLRTAASGLKGLDQVRVNKQLEGLQHVPDEPAGPVRTPDKSTTQTSGAPATLPEKVASLVGTVFVNGKQSSVYLFYRPGHRLTNEDFTEIVAATGIDVTRITELRILFSGEILAREPATVMMTHAVNSGARSMLDVDRYGRTTAADGSLKRVRVSLSGAPTAVQWELSAVRDFDNAYLAVVPAGTQASLEFAPANSLLESAWREAKAGRAKLLSYPPGLLKQ
jgi:hypothetical protein